MKITYDNKVDAGYVYLSSNKINKTIPMNEWLTIDVDSDSKIVGIEILDVSKRLSEQHFEELRTNTMKEIPSEILSRLPAFA